MLDWGLKFDSLAPETMKDVYHSLKLTPRDEVVPWGFKCSQNILIMLCSSD